MKRKSFFKTLGALAVITATNPMKLFAEKKTTTNSDFTFKGSTGGFRPINGGAIEIQVAQPLTEEDLENYRKNRESFATQLREDLGWDNYELRDDRVHPTSRSLDDVMELVKKWDNTIEKMNS